MQAEKFQNEKQCLRLQSFKYDILDKRRFEIYGMSATELKGSHFSAMTLALASTCGF